MKNYLESLNKSQREVATTIEGPMLVLAGAGAGKTHTMVTRAANMIEQGISPRSILMLTFTNKAAEEMIDRAMKYCGEQAKYITACTYHSFCTKMLRQYGKAIGLKTDFDILTATQSTEAIAFIKSRDQNVYETKGLPQVKVISNIFSAMINQDKSLEEILEMEAYSKYLKFKKQLSLLLDDYTSYKKEKALLDYDDLMVYFYQLLSEVEPVRKRIEFTYKYIIVDEYQDTNNLQSKILQEMRKDCDNIAVVGDDAQSIYGFRGANVQNIINFPKLFKNCKVVQLTENYRSSNEILQLANVSYGNYATEGFPKQMRGQFESGCKPVVIRPKDEEGEAEEVFKGIVSRMMSGVSPENICVVARTSRAFFRLEQKLNSQSIAYEKRGGLKFMELPEVLDMIAYLRISTNSLDELSLFRVLQLHPGIGENYARKICEQIGIVDNPIIDNKYKKYKFGQELVLLHDVMTKARIIPNEDLSSRFTFIANFYIDLLKRSNEESSKSEEARLYFEERLEQTTENLKEMGNMLSSYKSVTDFLDSLVLDQIRVDNSDLLKVVLTTIHSVKGLEFDTVFAIGCVDGSFPRGEAWETTKEEDQEELRCFYVAITRAENRLYIVAPREALKYGNGFFQSQLTRFLKGCEKYYQESNEFVDEVLDDDLGRFVDF